MQSWTTLLARTAATLLQFLILVCWPMARCCAMRPRAQASRSRPGYIVLVATQIVDAAYRLGFLMLPTLGAGAHLACI
ncbi:MAG: hypothetical protein ABI256_05940 [Rhodoferax sp.]